MCVNMRKMCTFLLHFIFDAWPNAKYVLILMDAASDHKTCNPFEVLVAVYQVLVVWHNFFSRQSAHTHAHRTHMHCTRLQICSCYSVRLVTKCSNCVTVARKTMYTRESVTYSKPKWTKQRVEFIIICNMVACIYLTENSKQIWSKMQKTKTKNDRCQKQELW